MAALIAVGVDNPTAHGQATSSMVIARRTSRVARKVSAASANRWARTGGRSSPRRVGTSAWAAEF